MTTTTLTPVPKSQFFDNNGKPFVGAKLFTYEASTDTKLATYTDSTGDQENTNPVILDYRGEANVWIPPNVAYKFVLASPTDTDPPGRPIWSVDQIVNNQLISLYGGVDTGQANAYVLNFASSVPVNTDGQVIYWLPANSNTGPSTINVNGAGPQAIVNPNGSVLGANQILAGQFLSIIFINGIWQLYGGSGVGVNVGTFGAETPIIAATTTDLGSVPGHNVQINGTTTITSFGTSAQTGAPIYIGRFTGSLTLTNSASLILPGGNNITTNNGDAFIAEYMGMGNWRVLFYQYISATSATSAIKAVDTARLSTTTLTADPDLQLTLLTGQYSYELFLLFDSVSGAAGFKFQSDGTATDSRSTSPAGATGFVNAAAYGPKLESFVGGPISYGTVSTSVDGNQVLYKGSLLINSAGTFGIQWAQNASTASNTTLRAGSYLTATLLAQKVATSGITHIYTSATTASETIPAGMSTCTIEGWGAAGRGGARFSDGFGGISGGGGGGSGGYFRKVISVAADAGKTLVYTVGAAGAAGSPAGASEVSTGTLTIATLTANGGAIGGTAPNLGSGGVGGAGGTATGGDVNTTGNTGGAGVNNSGGGMGGTGAAGVPGINYGGTPGGTGGSFVPATDGGAGVIVFAYSP